MPNSGTHVLRSCLMMFGCSFGACVFTTFGAGNSGEPIPSDLEYDRRTWTKENGLPDNQVQWLFQSSDGYLWVRTRTGLARFDGVKFTKVNHADALSAPNDEYTSLAEDFQGNLWMVTRSELLRFRDQGVERYGRQEGVCGIPPYRFIPSRRGGFWITSREWLTRFHDGKMTCFGESNGLLGQICSLNEDDNGVLWIGLGSGLQRFDPQTATFSTNCIPQHLGHTVVQILQRDRQGRIWAAFEEIHPGGAPKEWVHWFANAEWHSCPGNPQGNGARPFFILPDHDDNVWMPAGYGQILRFREGRTARFTLAGDARETVAQCALADREGNLWFGTESDGLQRWTPGKVAAYTAREGLANENSWTICEGRDGSVWIGTDGGLSHLQDGKITNFGEQQGLSRKEVRSVVEDQAGSIWVGTMSGLYLYRDGKLSKYQLPGEWFEGKVRTLLPTRDGALWVGTVTGLTKLQNGQQTKYSVTNGLAHIEVCALMEDRAGNLWIGTAGGGVQRFGVPPSGGSANHTGFDSPDAPDRLKPGLRTFTTFAMTNGLSNDSAWALYEDANRVLWIGTKSGLNRLEEGRITAFTTRDGLPDNLVNYILEDDFGRLWVSHDQGIYWVRKQELNDVAAGRIESVNCVTYDESDGLPSLETNGQKSNPAGCKTRDGRLWFPTTKGVVVIDPRKADLAAIPPLAAIELVRANGSVLFDNWPIAAGRVDTRAEVQTAKSKAVSANSQLSTINHQLKPGGARVLEFRYTANTFVAPEKARFKYRMLGVDDHWTDAGTRREAYFTNLRPGKHQFEVKAANHHGVWQERGAVFAFYLSPFFYQTVWFYSVCGLATAGLAVGFIGWRIGKLRELHRLEQQSAITDERTRIAKDLHDGLGADLTRLTMLADLATGESGAGSGEHLRKLSQFSRDATRELKELIWIANPTNDTVEGLVSRICQSAEDFLGDARIRCRLDLSPHLPQQPLSLDQRRNLLLVAREALNNIVKHATATEVCIRAHGSNDSLILAIEDNGRGLDAASMRPDALGLASMRRRVENMGGSFQLESRPGSGTKIMIELKTSGSQ